MEPAAFCPCCGPKYWLMKHVPWSRCRGCSGCQWICTAEHTCKQHFEIQSSVPYSGSLTSIQIVSHGLFEVGLGGTVRGGHGLVEDVTLIGLIRQHEVSQFEHGLGTVRDESIATTCTGSTRSVGIARWGQMEGGFAWLWIYTDTAVNCCFPHLIFPGSCCLVFCC